MHSGTCSPRHHKSLAGLLGLILIWSCLPQWAAAQRPYRVYDPFYRGETARRAFYDGYAFTTEIFYRGPGAVQDGSQVLEPDPLGLSFRLDYQVSPRIDLGAIIDAAGSNAGRTLTMSWLTFKYYHTVENTDYAFRLAVDPSLDGRIGHPQIDLAFISTSLLSPILSSDYALGVRRVRIGYEQLVPGTAGDAPSVPERLANSTILYKRALGWEVHFMMQYAVLLNPARSNFFLSFLADGGEYDLFESAVGRSNAPGPRVVADEDSTLSKKYRGGVVWLRGGIEYNRPSYQVMPFLSLPLKQWVPEDAAGKARIHVGVRFMLR